MQSMRSSGIALVVSLVTIAIVGGIAAIMFSRTVAEIRHSAEDAGIVSTLMLARGAANVGRAALHGPLRNRLEQAIQANPNTTSPWGFGNNSSLTPNAPDPASVASDLRNVAMTLQSTTNTVLCNQNVAPSGSGATATVRVYFTPTACNQGLPSGIRLTDGRFISGSPGGVNTFALPYVMVVEAQQATYRRNIVISGEYRFNVGRVNFARYALFTNFHVNETNTAVWFTDRTLFDGPVHTNTNFRFAGRPWFGAEVSSVGCGNPGTVNLNDNPPQCSSYNPGAFFISQSPQFVGAATIESQPNANNPIFGSDAPNFNQGADWRANYIPLPQNSLNQEAAANAGGLVFNTNLSRLTLFAGDSSGAPLTRSGTSWIPNPAPFQYIEACRSDTGVCTRYRYSAINGPLYQQAPDGSWSIEVRSSFNGLILTNGQVNNFSGPARATASDPSSAPPALASFAQLTVMNTGNNNIRISGDLTYQDLPCTGAPTRQADGSVTSGTCNNRLAQNVLGVYSPQGNVVITDPAPNNITLHAVIMAASGVIRAENHASRPVQGSVNLLGGLIQNRYGAFGTFSGSNLLSGYGRSFKYDERMREGLAPPFFPTTGNYQVSAVWPDFFGQKEQQSQ